MIALAISALVVAVVVATGIGIDWTLGAHPTSTFANCRTQPLLAPKLYSGPPPMCIDTKANYVGIMKTTKGDIVFDLLTRQTPKTVNNFVVLAVNGYFNGQPYWSSQDWEIQTGDPDGTGHGGPGYTLGPEPAATNDQWPLGSMGMARFPDGTISGSQFFILKSVWPGGNPVDVYNHFATVTLGNDIVSTLDTTDRILSVEIKRS